MSNSLEKKINVCWDKTVVLQMISAFAPDADFGSYEEMTTDICEFLKRSSDVDLLARLWEIDRLLDEHLAIFSKRYPFKASITSIASKWKNLFKNGVEVYSYGITYGWLEELVDLRNYRFYNHVPYHFRIGLAANKGHCAIEEEALLKDAFNVLLKAEYYHQLAIDYGVDQGRKFEKKGAKQFDAEIYRQITDIKYEASSYSRLTVVSFYAFMEAFVNSVGFSFLNRNSSRLSVSEKEILSGSVKGRFLQLKSKIEKFQRIIREDNKTVLITSDQKQMNETVRTFFDDYEDLRNASVHYSPLKVSISMKNKDWIVKAKHFSTISVDMAKLFWNACYPEMGDPEYLGELNYLLHYENAYKRLRSIKRIEDNTRN